MNLGVIYGLLALVCFTLIGTVLKKVSKFDWYSLTIIRYFTTIITLTLVLLFFNQSFTIPSSEIPLLLMISVFGAVAYILLILAMRFAPASIVSAITNSFGLLVVLLSFLFLNEVLLPLQYGGIAAIFTGMVFLYVRKTQGLKQDLIHNRGFYFSLLTFFLWGITFFLIAIPIRHIGALRTSFYFELIMFLFFLLFLPWKRLEKPSKSILLYLLFLGVFSGLAGVFLALSIREIGPSLANAIAAGVPLGVVILASLWLKERLKPHQYAGIALIVIGLIIISLVTS